MIGANGRRVTVTKTRTFQTENTLSGPSEEVEMLPSYSLEGRHVNGISDTEFEVLGTGEKLKLADASKA